MQFKPGDRVVSVWENSSNDEYSNEWISIYTKGSIHTLVKTEPEYTPYWHTTSSSYFRLSEDDMILESLYNSRLYKALTEDE